MPGPEDKDKRPTPWGDDTPTLPTSSPPPAGSSAEVEAPFDTASLFPLAERYDVLNELGRGGMGAIYRARDRETGDVVALKVLLPEIAGRADLIERFKSELLLARKVTHKNVCRVHDLNRFGTVVAISMEYVQGDSLRTILRRFGSVSVRNGVEWTRQICSALGEAHGQGVIHRDLKPENILITRDGAVKVMDFGIARSVDALTAQTIGIIGTPAYMSPEQVEGKPADARSDIYSLGLVMYEMFTGQPAFRAETSVAMVAKHVHETPPDPIKVEPLLPVFLDRAIRKCLEKNPKKRFQSVADLQAALAENSGPAASAEVEAEEEVPVPIGLAHWRHEESYLLGAAILAFALFFFLYDGLFPWAGVEFQINAEQASQKSLRLVSKSEPSARVSSVRPMLGEAFQEFHRVLLLHGLLAFNQVYRDNAPGWQISLEVGEQPSRQRKARVSLTPRGGLYSFSRDQLPTRTKGAPPTEEQVLPAAVQFIKDYFGQDLSKTAPSSPPRILGDQLLLRWDLPGPRPGTKHAYILTYDSEGVTGAWSYDSLDWGQADSEANWRAASQIRARWITSTAWMVLGLGGLALLMVVLFFVRRLYQRTQPRAFLIALVAPLALGGIFLSVQDPTSFTYNPYTLPPSAVMCFLFAYALANTAEHYLTRAMPGRAATWRLLSREMLKGQAAGLAIARGAIIGVLFLGLYVAVLRGLALLGWIGPSTVWLAMLSVLFSFLFAPSLAILATLAGAYVAVAFPAALAARASRRALMPVLVPAVLCLLTASTLPGASAFPSSPELLMAALQGFFFAYVLYRYDFLTLLIAMFTVETWVLVYPVYRMFHRVEWWKSSLGMLPWYLLLLLGLTIYFRPQLTAGLRRVAAVFE